MSEKALTTETERVSDGEMRFMFIHPEYIVENKLNDAPINDIEDMMSSIRMNGLRQPLDVLPEENKDTFRIIGGHRRFEAIKRGIKEGYGWFSKGIPCVIQESQIESTLDEQIVMHEENINSRNYKDGNYLEGIKTLYMLYQEKSSQDKTFKGSAIIKRLAEKLNVGTRQAYKTAFIATSADTWITNAVEDKLLTIDAAAVIAHLDEQKQEELHKYFDEHHMIPKDVLDMYRKNADKKEASDIKDSEMDNTSEKEDNAPEKETDPVSEPAFKEEMKKEPEVPDNNAARKQEIKEMVRKYDDSDFFGADSSEGFSDIASPEYEDSMYREDRESSEPDEYEEDFTESMGMNTSAPSPSADNQMKMDPALTALSWFSALTERGSITGQEKAYIDTILQMMASVYFPYYVKQGYVDGNMKKTMEEIVDMMSGLL